MQKSSLGNRILGLFIITVSFLVFTFGASADDKQSITLLFTNDTHNHLQAFDSKDLKDMGGIARRANLFNSIRKENPDTIILDSGDTFQGTPFYNFFKGELDFWGMSMAGYDATTLGNHDLDDGMPNLKKQSQYEAVPILCSNITDRQGYLIFRPYQIFRVNNVRIAVVGLMGYPAWNSVAIRYTQDLILHDPVDTAKKMTEIVRKYADIVIFITHNGFNEDKELAEKVDNIDIILGGHSHTKLEEPVFIKKEQNNNGINGTIITQTLMGGMYVGRLDLTINNNKIQSYNGQLIPVTSKYDVKDNEIDKKISEYSKKIDKIVSEVIGEASTTFGVEEKYSGQCPLGMLVTSIIREKFNADIGIVNSGGLRQELPKGVITVGKIYELMPFDNALVVFEWSGKSIKAFVEENEKRQGKHKTFQFTGLSYKANNGKAESIMVGNKPLDINKNYKVVTVDYVFSGNEEYKFDDAQKANMTSILLRDVIIEYIKKHKKI